MKPVLLPYKVLATLAWGDFPWLERGPGGRLTVPTARLAEVTGISKSPRLRACVDHLAALGLLEGVRWYRGWFVAHLRPISVTLGPIPEGDHLTHGSLL